MSDYNDLDSPADVQSRLRLAPAGPRSRIASNQDMHFDAPGVRDLHLIDYIKVLYKRRWLAGTAFVAVVAFSTVNAYTTIPLYQAQVQVLIDKENANVVTFKQAIEQNQSGDDYYQTQYKILQSRALARRTIDALKLWNHEQLNPKPSTSPTVRGVLMAPFAAAWRLIRGSSSSSPTRQGPAPAPDETRHQSAVIDRFLDSLSVVPIRNSRLVDIRYSSTSPTFAADVANAHARAFVDQALEFKFLASKDATDWLAIRLAEQRKQVDASEHAMQQYREQNDAIALDDRSDIVVQKLSDLNAAVTRAKTERIEKEALYRQVQAIQHDPGALDTFPAILSNSFVQTQKAELANLQRQLVESSEKLGDRHPEIVKLRTSIQVVEAKLKGETAKVVESIRNQYQASVAQENSLTEALNQQKQEAMSMNRKGIEYGVLAREAASNRQIFDSLMQRTKETGISGELKTNNIRIVDIAETPRGAFNVNRTNSLLLSAFSGALAGIALAFFFEYLDNRIKLPDELTRHLGLSFLGMIPAQFDKNAENPLICNGVPPNFLESFRGLRTNLLFSSAEAGSRSIAVTSTGPGEGKTLIASNLAVSIAQAGPRVLLIDADMRKPRVHTLFERRQEPGLSNVLVGTAKASDSVHRTSIPGLWLMTAGTHPPNAAELLGSKRFREFLSSLSQHFDWVIVDTPPVMAVTDASVAANAVTGVLFVVGAQLTSRYTAQRAIEQLRHARANILGGVLNRVDLKHHAYYYSTYYRRDYADYYQKPSARARTGT